MLLSGVFFAHKVRRILEVNSELSDDGRVRTYTVTGQVFFASAERFIWMFDYQEKIEAICIDVTHTRFWDLTAIEALDRVVLKLRRGGTLVEVRGLESTSATLVERFGIHHMDGVTEYPKGH